MINEMMEMINDTYTIQSPPCLILWYKEGMIYIE